MSRRSAGLDPAAFHDYRPSVVTNRLSRTLAGLYADRFDLTLPEWPVIAVRASSAGQSADQIAAAAARMIRSPAERTEDPSGLPGKHGDRNER